MNYLEQSISELTARRCAAQAVSDQCETAIAALRALLGEASVSAPSVPAKTRGKRRVVVKAAKVKESAPSLGRSVEAIRRRDAILGLMKSGPVTHGELRRKMPKESGLSDEQQMKALSNALSILKSAGTIKRAGSNWVLA